MKRKLFIIGICVAILCAGCAINDSIYTDGTDTSQDSTSATKEVFAMDTYMTVTAYGDDADAAVEAAVDEINRIDAMLSTGNPHSEIAKLNLVGSGTLSEETAGLVERSLEIGESVDGQFNIAIYPVMQLWGFYSGNYNVPSDDELTEALNLSDLSAITFDSETGEISFEKDGMAIDLGGIAKGYTSGRLMEIFEEYDCSGIVSLGGNIQATGEKPDGSKWKIAIQDPDDSSSYLGYVETDGVAVVTSGGYERYFEEDGVTYHHIIDPDTGYPADSGVVSASIISDDGTLADALSTTTFIMGVDEASEYWRNHSDEFDMVLYTEDGTFYVTEGIADSFVTDLDMTIIK